MTKKSNNDLVELKNLILDIVKPKRFAMYSKFIIGFVGMGVNIDYEHNGKIVHTQTALKIDWENLQLKEKKF